MKKKLVCLLTGGLALCSLSAIADTSMQLSPTQPSIAAPTNTKSTPATHYAPVSSSYTDQSNTKPSGSFFIGANVGEAQYATPNNASDGMKSAHDKYPVIWAVYAGQQWNINPEQGITLGWKLKYNDYGHQNFGANTGGNIDYSIESINLTAVLGKSWNNGLNVFVEGGGAYAVQEAQVNGPVAVNNIALDSGKNFRSQLLPYAAIGIGYMATPHVNLYLSADHLFGDTQHNFGFVNGPNQQNDDVFSVSTARIGINYLF